MTAPSEASDIFDEMSDDEILALLAADPAAFKAQADAACAWDDDALDTAASVLPERFQDLAYAASDDAVAKLRKRIGKKMTEEANERRLKLLAGVGTPAALAAVADLARVSPPAREIVELLQLEIPKKGPAVERFTRQSLEIVPAIEGVKKDARVALGGRIEELLTDPTGWACRTPLVHVLSIDLARMPGFPRGMKRFHWFGAACPQECAEGERYEYETARGGRLTIVESLSTERPPLEDRCEGGKVKASKARTAWGLVPPNHEQAFETVGAIGGRPRWQQSPDGADCRKCKRPMFYVGHVEATNIRGHVAPVTLYGFWCEDCQNGAQIAQMT